jgi:hypothetical protein
MNLNNIITAADTSAAEADGKGFFASVGDAITKGLPSAAASGLVSLANTGIFYKNKLFGGDTEELDTVDILNKGSESLGDYYKQNKEVLDTVGFVATSFLPGSLAVAGVRAAQAGRAAGAFKYSGLVPARAQEKALQEGLQKIAAEGPSVFSSLNSSRLAVLGWGTADNVVQALAFETAAAVTLYRSPTLKDESLGDITWDIVKSGVFGGLVGGGIEGLMTNKIFKNASKAVDGRLRAVDTIAAYERMGMNFGDEAFATIESVLGAAKRSADNPLEFSYRLNGKTTEFSLDTSGLTKRVAAETMDKALERVQAKLSYAVPGDPSVGRGLGKGLIELARKGLKDGVPEEEILRSMGDVLWGMKRAEGLGSEQVNFAREVFWVLPGSHLGTREGLSSAITTAKPGKNAQGYIMQGSWDNAKLGTLGQDGVPATLKDAWMMGFDSVIDPAARRFEINPESAIFKKINPKSQDDVVSRVYQPRTHTSSDDALPYFSDLATQNAPLTVTAGGLSAGKKTFSFSTTAWKGTDDVLEATARHIWADKQVSSLKGLTISWDDFSLLNKALEKPNLVDANTMIRLAGGEKIALADLSDFSGWLIGQKLKKMEMLGSRDSRELAGILGTEPQWVQQVTESGGNIKALRADTQYAFRPLESFAERENVVLSYDRASMEVGSDFADGMLAYQNRVSEGIRQMDVATKSVLSEDLLKTMPEAPGVSVKQANSAGAGPGAFSFSDADYTDLLKAYLQSLGQWVQNSGQVHKSQLLDQLQPAGARILAANSPELGAVTSWYRSLDEAVALDGKKIVDLAYYKAKQSAAQKGKQFTGTPKISKELSEDTAEFLRIFHTQHSGLNEKQEVLRQAQGLSKRYDPDQLYLPPIDTRKTPYFALVKEVDGKAFGTGEVSMITARTPTQLQEMVASVKEKFPDFEIHFKGDTEAYHKAQGQYDFQSAMNSTQIDSALRKQGILRDFNPVMETRAVIDEYVNFTGRSSEQFLRNVVSAKNAQLFRELEWLSEQNTKIAESKMGYLGKWSGKTLEDPFGDYKRLALNISKKAEYPIWHQMNEFVDSLGTRAYQAAERVMANAQGNKISWEAANKELEKYGLKGGYSSEADYFDAQLRGSGNLFRTAIAKANTLLSTVGLRLDSANAAVNILSSPLMQAAEISSLKRSIANDPVLAAKFESMTTVTSPDGKIKLPSIGKLWTGATAAFFGEEGKNLIARYEKLGVVKSDLLQFHAMLETLSLLPTLKDAGKFGKTVDQAVELGAKWTGNNFAEKFTRFISADMMRQITDPIVAAGKMAEKEQDTWIRIFVNRTQGNYVASQRPIAFQGTVGTAISLFQTYSFNLYQQLFRHIEDRNLRTVAVMGGMQSGLFGLNGLPMFDAINTHLIGMAHINEGHKDAYSTAVQFGGKELGDWAMYGSLSALPLFSQKAPALYTRGDLNPRHLTVLPTSFADVPAVSVGTRILQAVQGFGNEVGAGNRVGDAFLHAMEQNGLSRPLAGLASIIQGDSTTSKGSLISAHSDLLSVANAARIAGARPLDEAVALNTKFRLDAYKAYDRDRIEKLGTAVKQRLRSGDVTEDEFLNFAAEYTARGGKIESYNAAMVRWMKDANQSVVNTLMQAHKSTYGQRLLEVMGGDPLPDYTNQPKGDK